MNNAEIECANSEQVYSEKELSQLTCIANEVPIEISCSDACCGDCNVQDIFMDNESSRLAFHGVSYTSPNLTSNASMCEEFTKRVQSSDTCSIIGSQKKLHVKIENFRQHGDEENQISGDGDSCSSGGICSVTKDWCNEINDCAKTTTSSLCQVASRESSVTRSNPAESRKKESALSDIGADYMRINGAIGSFKQLQKPHSIQSLPTSSKMSYVSIEEAGLSLVTGVDYAKFTYDKISQKQRQMPNVGYRLGKKRELYQKRRKVSDYCLVFAMLGVVLMILETELTTAGLCVKVCVTS